MEFNTDLMCFSIGCSSMSEDNIKRLQNSNQIVLPSSVLSKLSDKIEFPVFFKLTNMKTGNAHVCGVYEFTSPPGVCHIPYRVMEQLWISEGENVNICIVYPEDGTYIKLKPQTTDFINLSNPKIVLEKTMSLSYPVVSAGDTISIDYNNNIYYIDIVECKPIDTIKIINVDVNVDFEEPEDYKKHLEKKKKEEQTELIEFEENINLDNNVRDRTSELKKFSKKDTNTFIPFSGKGNRLGSE